MSSTLLIVDFIFRGGGNVFRHVCWPVELRREIFFRGKLERLSCCQQNDELILCRTFIIPTSCIIHRKPQLRVEYLAVKRRWAPSWLNFFWDTVYRLYI